MSDPTLYDTGPPDGFLLTIPEVGAAVVLVVGAICAVTVRVLWSRWKP